MFWRKSIIACFCVLALLPLYSSAIQYNSSIATYDEVSGNIVANVSGVVTNVLPREGDYVAEGQYIMALESSEIDSPADGYVASVNVSVGDYVLAGDTLIELE